MRKMLSSKTNKEKKFHEALFAYQLLRFLPRVLCGIVDKIDELFFCRSRELVKRKINSKNEQIK